MGRCLQAKRLYYQTALLLFSSIKTVRRLGKTLVAELDASLQPTERSGGRK